MPLFQMAIFYCSDSTMTEKEKSTRPKTTTLNRCETNEKHLMESFKKRRWNGFNESDEIHELSIGTTQALSN